MTQSIEKLSPAEPRGEVWVRIQECPDYAISGDGRVMRITPSTKCDAGYLMKPQLAKIGYFIAYLRQNGKYAKRYVHRLVASLFIPNPENKPEVNHKDGVKTNNCISNLEWATHAENMKHGFETKLCPTGERCPWAKLTYEKVESIRDLSSKGWSYSKLAKTYGVSQRLVSGICKGTKWAWAK